MGLGSERMSESLELNLRKYHYDFSYLSELKLHVDTKVDEQTMLFFYIQAFLLPEDNVTEVLKSFSIRHPF